MIIDVDHMSARHVDDTLDIAEAGAVPRRRSPATPVSARWASPAARTSATRATRPTRSSRASATWAAWSRRSSTRADATRSASTTRGRGDARPFRLRRLVGGLGAGLPLCRRADAAGSRSHRQRLQRLGRHARAALRRRALPRRACTSEPTTRGAPAARIPFTAGITATLDRQQVASGRSTTTPTASPTSGMYPDFIEDLRQIGVTNADLAPLFGVRRGVHAHLGAIGRHPAADHQCPATRRRSGTTRTSR